jgi:hypothetical protein
MGTDIHMRAETRLGPDEPWLALDGFPNPYYDPIRSLQLEAEAEARGEEPWTRLHSDPTTPEPYDGRNYTLFAALSDVRNGYGFAGVDLGDPIPPSVAAGRGLPDDLAFHHPGRYSEGPIERPEGESNLEYAERHWIFGEHSFGYLTLREVLDYDWDFPVVHRGVVSREEHEAMAREGRMEPKSFCGSVSGGGVKVVDRFGGLPEDYTHVKCQWMTPLRDSVGGFMDVVDTLRKWGGDYELWHSTGGHENPKSTMYDPDCIRLVFGYDS